MVDPSSLSARCTCGTDLWAVRDGQWTLASRVVRLRANLALEARCPECRELVALPFLELREMPVERVEERVVATKGRVIVRRHRIAVPVTG